MRVLVDLKSHVVAIQSGQGQQPDITQVEQVPEIGDPTPINGRYVMPVIRGIDFPVDSSTYVLNTQGQVDGGDIASITYSHLLSMFPMFGNVYFNPLLTPEHVDELDFTKTFKEVNLPPPDGPSPPKQPVYFPVRVQSGREPISQSQTLDPGQMPTHTALLAQNNRVKPPRPGMLITNEIDIGPYTLDGNGNQVGADDFMLYWKLYDFQVSADIAADYGVHAGQNDPAIRSIVEVDQEPTGFSAYISPDDGANWCEVGLLEPVAFCSKTTKIRVAFKNTGSAKVFIATFGVLF